MIGSWIYSPRNDCTRPRGDALVFRSRFAGALPTARGCNLDVARNLGTYTAISRAFESMNFTPSAARLGDYRSNNDLLRGVLVQDGERTSPHGVVVAHAGAPLSAQHSALALLEEGLLRAFCTSFRYDKASRLGRTLRAALSFVYSNPDRELSRRTLTQVPSEYVITHPAPEIIRMAARKIAGEITGDLAWDIAEMCFSRWVARHLNGTAAAYAYEYTACNIFKQEKQMGGLCFYDLAAAHHRTADKIRAAECEMFPKALIPQERYLRSLWGRRKERKDEELHLADRVIAHSTFTKSTLLATGIPEDAITVVPYGAPPIFSREQQAKRSRFIFLSVGTHSLLKGSHYLLDAWRRLSPSGEVELHLYGTMLLPPELTRRLPGKVIIHGSVPHWELTQVYRGARVLVFPSLCDGFGLVITEAMSQGLPVITTWNTGGPDIIEHGRSGILIPIRDAHALAEAMQWCLDHPRELAAMSREAADAADRWQWSDYRRALGRAVRQFVENGHTDDRVAS